jgi:hypothetical protein
VADGSFVTLGVTSLIPQIPFSPFVLSIKMVQFDIDNAAYLPSGQAGVYVPDSQILISQL